MPYINVIYLAYLSPEDQANRHLPSVTTPIKQAVANRAGYAPQGNTRRFLSDADGILAAWKECVYAETQDDYHNNWNRLKQEFPDQMAIVNYLNDTYNCWVFQFAQFAVKQHRNYGLKVTSRVESQHAALKRNLRNRLADLHQLHRSIQEMLRRQEERWLDGVSNEKEKHITVFEGDQCLRLLWSKAAHQAIRRTKEQLDHALEYLKHHDGMAPPDELCTGSFTQQFALPCWHRLASLLETNTPCLLTEIGQFYWYEPHIHMTEEEIQLRLEQHPRVNPSLAWRRQNRNAPTPTSWLNALADGESTSHTRDLSHDEPPRRKRPRTTAKAPTMKNLMMELLEQRNEQDRRFALLEERMAASQIPPSQASIPSSTVLPPSQNTWLPPPSNQSVPWYQAPPRQAPPSIPRPQSAHFRPVTGHPGAQYWEPGPFQF